MSPITTGTSASYQWEWAACDYSGKPKDTMQTQFKAGDRVEVLKYADPEYKGLTGIVTGYEKGAEPSRAIIRPDSGRWKELYFFDEYLRLIDSPAPVFKVGDRVEVVKIRDPNPPETVSALLGRHGTVTEDQSLAMVWVRMDRSEDGKRCYYPDELRLLSPHSPQPQQNQQPKEESMYPYVVLFHNLAGASQASVHSHHVTEEQAKQQAETLVAELRGNLQKKSYFTVTIVNTKTGELVGSVSDAPPAVDWAKK